MKIKIEHDRVEIYDFNYNGKPHRTKIFLDTLKFDRKQFKKYLSGEGVDVYLDIWFHIKPQLEREYPELFL